MDYEIKLESPQGNVVSLGNVSKVPSQGIAKGRFMVQLPKNQLSGLQTPLVFGVYVNGKKLETVKSGFLGPSTN